MTYSKHASLKFVAVVILVAATAWVPTVEVAGMNDPVVQIVDEAYGEMVYTLRINRARRGS